MGTEWGPGKGPSGRPGKTEKPRPSTGIWAQLWCRERQLNVRGGEADGGWVCGSGPPWRCHFLRGRGRGGAPIKPNTPSVLCLSPPPWTRLGPCPAAQAFLGASSGLGSPGDLSQRSVQLWLGGGRGSPSGEALHMPLHPGKGGERWSPSNLSHVQSKACLLGEGGQKKSIKISAWVPGGEGLP